MIFVYFVDIGVVLLLDFFIMLWLLFYYDMGLVLGVCVLIIVGCGVVFISLVVFL